jgi:hypothetical protein
MIKGLFVLILLWSSALLAQENTRNKDSKFSFSGYLETYYSYDFNQPDDHLRPSFLYNFKRHNEFSVNLALLQASYQDENIRANLGLMLGNYAQFNLAEEPNWAKMIYEASIGFQLLDKLWLDVGIMPSHIGFETAIGADGWHLSRSLLAENSPYFLTGARFSYEFNAKIDLTFWLTNGWQNIQRIEGNQALGLGLGINYRPIENLEFNYSNYFGNEQGGSFRQNRFFNNFYAQYHFGKWGATLGTDFGIEPTISGIMNEWTGITASLKRTLTDKVSLAGRAEYYSDPAGVILREGLKVSGLSSNLDYQIHPAGLIRLELRQFIGQEPIFNLPAARFSKGNTAMTVSFSTKF